MGKLNDILNSSLEQLKPLYVISSEDRYILASFKEKFEEKFIEEGIRGFNYTYLEEVEDFPVVLKNQANTPPMMAEKRFIIARTENYFSSKQSKEELLIGLFNNFPETTILVILVAGKINNRLKIVSEAKKVGEVITASAPKFADLDKWIMAEFRRRGKHIDKTSVNFLEQMFSNNMQRLESEVEKISLYKSEDDRINLDDILQIVSKDRLIEDNLIFSLTDAMMSRKTGEAIKILKQMIHGGAIPLVVLGTMIWQIRLLLSVKVLKEEGNNIRQIAKRLKSHEYPVKKCYSYSNNFSERELEDMLEGFLEANNSIVTGKYDPEMALELAIIG
ncbi:MAG: DNA polymerase III subunit delta [Halanaerobiales bacterium]